MSKFEEFQMGERDANAWRVSDLTSWSLQQSTHSTVTTFVLEGSEDTHTTCKSRSGTSDTPIAICPNMRTRGLLANVTRKTNGTSQRVNENDDEARDRVEASMLHICEMNKIY